MLRRTPDDTDPAERPIVANADQLIVVVALTSPPARPRMIDRCLVAAYDGGLTPVLCLTKHDLAGKLAPDDTDRDALTTLTAAYEPLGVPVVTAGVDDSIDPIKAVLAGKMSVLFGHSGVGKSTLVNRLVPGAYRATGEVSDIGRGRHVSSSVIALELPGGGWVVDTPGCPVVRPRPGLPGAGAVRVRGPRCRHRGVPARLHPPRRLPRLHARRLRGHRAGPGRTRRLAAPAAALARGSRRLSARLPGFELPEQG